jgi:hypothetical protein
MYKFRLARLVWHFELELDGYATEALTHVRLDGCEEFVAEHLGKAFADD